MTAYVDRALAKARIAPRPYTVDELAQAEERLTARINRRMWYGALTFDDRMEDARAAAAREAGRDALPRRSYYQQLAILCETVVARDLHKLRTFLTGRVLEPEGARVLGSVLHLADREDSARFWWQFAAGADDTAAACCLYLHHMAYGERSEAELWRRQAAYGRPCTAPGDGPGDGRRGPSYGGGPSAGEPSDSRCGDLAGVLRLLERLREGQLREGHPRFTPAASAVIEYVPFAVDFVEDIELPLPDADFSARIDQLTASTAP